MDSLVFPIAPVTARGLGLMAVVPAAVVLFVVALLGAGLMSSRSARFELSPAGLRLYGDLYGRLVPFDQIRADDATRVNFALTPALEPRIRTMGTGLPGYRGGWFRLRNGEKALLYLTDESRAVYVPTTAGYSVIVSPADPDAFLASLKRR